MKLSDNTNGAGFYEAFSDVIFSTMAIFVLLMIIFMVLTQESSKVTKAQKKLEAVQAQIAKTKKEIEKIANKSESIESEIKKLAGRDVEIAIAVDKTGSMEQELYNLKKSIKKLAKILPKITDNVSISVVAYRIDEGNRNDTSFFPMTQIKDSKKDGNNSYQQLTQFLKQQRHKGGSAPILEATEQALSQFKSSSDDKVHQVFMLLGDVGPYEDTYDSADIITQYGKQKAQKLISTIKSWVAQRKNRNLIVLFSGRDEVFDYGTSGDRRYKHKLSMGLFKKIAIESDQPKAYTENQSTMLADFIIAALKRK